MSEADFGKRDDNILTINDIYITNEGYAIDNDELEISADQFTYDKENKRIFATGNVELVDENFKVFVSDIPQILDFIKLKRIKFLGYSFSSLMTTSKLDIAMRKLLIMENNFCCFIFLIIV